MRTIYLDTEFKCHVTDDGTMTPVQTDFFDNKCDTLVEGYRFIPEGENWTREDGVTFVGEMVAPCVDYDQLDAPQRQYEQELILDMQQALAKMGVTLNE